MSEKFEKLKTLLKELFQLDQPDLDFGLYRIMHAKSGGGDAIPRQGSAAASEGGIRPLQDGRQGGAGEGAGQGHRAGASRWASTRDDCPR